MDRLVLPSGTGNSLCLVALVSRATGGTHSGTLGHPGSALFRSPSLEVLERGMAVQETLDEDWLL